MHSVEVRRPARNPLCVGQVDYPAPLSKSSLAYNGGGRGGGRGGSGRGRRDRDSRHGGSNKGRPRSDFDRFG